MRFARFFPANFSFFFPQGSRRRKFSQIKLYKWMSLKETNFEWIWTRKGNLRWIGRITVDSTFEMRNWIQMFDCRGDQYNLCGQWSRNFCSFGKCSFQFQLGFVDSDNTRSYKTEWTTMMITKVLDSFPPALLHRKQCPIQFSKAFTNRNSITDKAPDTVWSRL